MTHQSKTIRPGKGKSLVEALDTYVAFDIETTGFSPAIDDIIEIGAVLVDKGIIVDTFETFVRPSCLIPLDVTALTGITNDMVADAPPIEQVLNDFLQFIGSNTLVGHNVSFDVNFVYDAAVRCTGHGIDNDFVNTVRIAHKVVPELPSYRLPLLLAYFNLRNDSAHRALSDAKATCELYELMKKCIFNGEILPYSPAFGGYTYEDVFDSIKYIVDDTEPNVELKINKNYASVYMFGCVAFEIRINSRSRLIETGSPEAESFVERIPGSKTSAAGKHRFPLATAPEHVRAVEDMIREVYNAYASLMRGEAFGCCNDFVRCSDARECLHKLDPDYAGCYYRKNLEAGRIFYGKNKTI